jgi:probable rRNA maturation factor
MAAQMAERSKAELDLALAYEPPGDVRALFGLDEDALHTVAALALARVGVARPVEVSVLIGDDEGIRALNRDYRGRDEATDVLSFPLLEAPLVSAPEDELWPPADTVPSEHTARIGDIEDQSAKEMADGVQTGNQGMRPDAPEAGEPEAMPLHLGDIAISREAILRQAMQASHSPAWELAYLLAHGVLHLVGYDDQTDAGYTAMVAHQEAILAQAGIAR